MMMNQQIIYRAAGAAWAAVMLGLMFALGLLGGIALSTHTPFDIANVILGGCLSVGCVVGIMWCLVFVRRTGVEIDCHGITIRNWLKVRRLPWTTISTFTVETGAFGVGNSLLDVDPAGIRAIVVLKDGSRLALTALKPMRKQNPAKTRERVLSIVDALNNALARQSGGE
jgi:hypothetical protein